MARIYRKILDNPLAELIQCIFNFTNGLDRIFSLINGEPIRVVNTYDELNRLISANGYDFGTIGDTPNSYSMTMEYNKMSSPIVFNQSITTDKGTIFKNNTYLYNQDTQPNAPVQIGEMYYSYDAAGNPTSILDASGMGRNMVWDAENRLKEIIDTKEGLFHSYTL